ncbi:MAG TPA: adenylate/guanylate cyclase domain-containing protein [Actinomycetota bacterium]
MTDEPSADRAIDDLGPPERHPDRLPRLVRPFAERVARVRATIHTKLLVGFLIIAALLLAMGVTSIVVIRQMNARAHEQIELRNQSDLARQAIYAVTAQSHYRAMALILHDGSYNDKIVVAKQDFRDDLDGIEAIGGPGVPESVALMRSVDERYAAAGDQVLALFDAGDFDGALDLHVSAEHAISHEIEDELNRLIGVIEVRVDASAASLASLHRFLLWAVVLFAGLSLLIALGLGAALSWSIIRPVRAVDLALARIAGGDFGEHVEVPNRDEFGRLTVNLNRTSDQLAELYADLSRLNAGLEQKVEDQIDQLHRAEQLRRYVAPQVADALLAGGAAVSMTSNRRNLTILFANVRGFTSLSERLEPEELIDGLNEHFAVMTDVVFRHDGTLDKYIGDGILAFFGDPIPFEDHAERAVACALEMRQRLRSLRTRWTLQRDEELNVGIGISTGYVTVGNIGSATRTEYTVIGNHVRLASHLAQIAGPDQILISDPTLGVPGVRERVHAISLEAIGLEGFRQPVGVYEISDLPAPLRHRL